MKINGKRIENNLLTVGMIGEDPTGGVTRSGFSKEYYEAVNELIKLFEKEELNVEVDGVGNVIGRREGNHDLPAIMIGSHLDTVKNGGLLDGALGVFAALECIVTLNENNYKTNHPIEIVAFNAEEGSEMGGTFGSRVVVGKQNIEEKNLEKKLSKYDLTIEDILKSQRNPDDIKAFLELHIEQGGYLEDRNLSIGVVDGIAGITRYGIKIKGEANHAGTTPMDLRKDALTMAAKLLLKIDEVAQSIGRPFVATVGQLCIKPNAVNVIPGEIELVLEMRDMNRDNIEYAITEIKKFANEMEAFDFVIELLIDKPNVDTDSKIMKTIEKVCLDNEIDYDIMSSGAGHDAKEMAAKVPIGMIFVPSKDGKSHCPEEYTSWEEIEVGAQVLFDTLIGLDSDV